MPELSLFLGLDKHNLLAEATERPENTQELKPALFPITWDPANGPSPQHSDAMWQEVKKQQGSPENWVVTKTNNFSFN